jgi:hypothetical protein
MVQFSDPLPVKQSKVQQELLELPISEDIRSSDWQYVRRFLTNLQRELREGKKLFLKLVADWSTAYDMLRAFEDSVMFSESGPSLSERQFFLGNVVILRGLGIHILNLLETHDLEIPPEMGLTVKDLAAMLAELKGTEAAHSIEEVPSKSKLLEEIFGGSKSGSD